MDCVKKIQERTYCRVCVRPLRTCYCAHVRSFDPKIEFVILIHRLEVRRGIASGRMSHLCLDHSKLIMGYDYSHDEQVNSIINDPKKFPVILFPGPASVNLSHTSMQERAALVPQDKDLVIFVIDGTWSTAGKTLRRSKNLQHLPRFSFIPTGPSRFRVRTQPKEGCFSTLEAIHQTIEMLGPLKGFDVEAREHDRLLHVFDKMVEQQLDFVRESLRTNRHSRHDRGRPRPFL